MKWLMALLLLVAMPSTAHAQTAADLRSNGGQHLATATFSQSQNAVLISIAFADRTALVGTHAAQIHSGQCRDPTSPIAVPLPDLVISPAGVSVYNLSTPTGVTLRRIAGTSLGIYDQNGQRVACGAIQASETGSDDISTAAIGVLGALLIAGGLVLRRGA
jgi:Cu/Zn superoxide dismutase